MKYLRQLLVICAVSLAGHLLNCALPLPVPAGIYGIIILFILLETKLLPLSAVEDTADFLVEIMPVMFIPPAVGLLESWGIIRSNLVAYAVLIPLSTAVVMAVSGGVCQLLLGIKGEKNTAGAKSTAGAKEGRRRK